jgi:hypothetical protein
MAKLRIAVLASLLVCALASGETKVPPIYPQITGSFPRGGQRGTEVASTIKGRNLQDALEVRFKSPKLTAKIISADPYEVKALVRIAPDAEPGRHDLRLVARHGSALNYFDVSTQRETTEKEPNEDAARAEPLSFPALVNGVLLQGDYDWYRFEVRKGQTLTFDVLGTRSGADTDAAIAIIDGAGEELAYSDDYYGFKDPHVVHTFDQDGTYYLRLSGSSEAGCETCDYRLIAGRMPWVELAMPGGGKRGSTVDFVLKGVNLESIKEVVLGDNVARGTVLDMKNGEARVRLTIPLSAEPGAYRLHVDGAPLSVPFVISGYKEVTVADGSARSRKDPVPVSIPVIANGILDRPGAADNFIFRIDEPTTLVFEAHAMQLGFLTDPMVVIYDEGGKRLAYQDEPTTNTGKEPANMDPHLVYRFEKPGRYIAAIRDAQFRGDLAFFYRLTMKRAEPEFSLRTIGADETLYRGRTNTVLVRVRRLEGWNAPLEVWAEALPPGVKAERVIVEPKNTPYTGTCGETHYLDGTNVEMKLFVDKDAPVTLGRIRFRGRGVFETKTVERLSRSRYFKSRIRHIGDAEEDDLQIAVADAPGVVLGVPRSLTLDKKNEASFTAIVTRLDEGSEAPLELNLEAAADGLAMAPVTVPVDSTRAGITVRAAAEAAAGEFILVGRVNGVVIGKSHPIRVRSKS